MINNIPFYKNDEDGNQCLQVATRSAIKHFLNKDYSLEELDRLTGKKANFWTYTSQIASVLHDVGLKIKYYSKEALEPFLEGESYLRKHYGKNADKILKFTNVPTVVESIENLLTYDIFKQKKISLSSIEEEIKKGYVPIVLIDNNIIIKKDDYYQGHAVVITGFDNEFIYYHDSGPSNPTSNKRIDKKIFIKAMDSNGTDNDCIIVFGKR